ncbi:glycosyl transferase family group 2-domain-containing protein [Sordaria brevicollis]|uniref:Glycosyl transferase family group 2-domain-containing protein n=1 Tax=Sordaria brevicollis TaxID=83679 RepID=A0AAE0PDH4_SORBR|nr:glycosyl transferase family group 2-domain-containing protein [Sordaria brevicollis]
MFLITWCSRRAGGLAMAGTIWLSYWVISGELGRQLHGYKQHESIDSLTSNASIDSPLGPSTRVRVFAYYCLLIHLLVVIFPLRSNWAVYTITKNLQKMARISAARDIDFAHQRRGSSTSLSSAETLTSSKDLSSSSSSEAGESDFELVVDCETPPNTIIHAIVIPNYKEETDTLRETLEVLASHPQARVTYDVYLAMEQRESDVETKAVLLANEFTRRFRSINFTVHPSNIPGELPGKGSNLAWAARQLSQRYTPAQRKDVIVTGIDADSHLLANYFTLVTTMHVAHPRTATTTLYSAPIVFDRNAHDVPAIVRVADIMWSAAGMSGLHQGSYVAPPTSVYSVPLELVDRVRGWDCDSEAIGEDLHMYLKCFFALNGNLTVRTVLSPVSQTNVTGGGRNKGLPGIVMDMWARYRQALRHMWGALDTGYSLRMMAGVWRERKHTSRAFRPLHASDGSDCYIPQAQLGMPHHSGFFSDIVTDTLEGPDYLRIFVLFHRLFEAHFLPVQMTILVIGSTLYLWLVDGAADAPGTGWIFGVCNVLRTVGFIEVGLYLFLYEKFHKICVETREKEMSDAGLTKGMHFSHRATKKNWIDYIMVPLVATVYGSIPCAHALIWHFWTLDLVYTVSKKVTRTRGKSVSSTPKIKVDEMV